MSLVVSQQKTNLFNSFNEYEEGFEYKGERLYSMIFERNRERIKVSKEKFAVKNLQKIFDATFLITPKIGFEAMSLRDLSAETGLSMGGLYSSVASKEAIAIMVKDVVAVVCGEIVDAAMSEKDPVDALQTLTRGYLYASTLMLPWFNFLYFETKSLPHLEQEASKNLELEQVNALANILKRIKPESSIDVEFIATMALSLIQERYVKPWKHHQPIMTVDQYADDCLALIYKSIDY
ncbi:MAG: AcrR family transcriptional regulator [Cocleimonas sp.]